MKIPETQVGAYYGNEENGQWQPNGVFIDSGVGGGVVGSGDAGVHRPPVYPLHIPRGHIPSYVMAGAYYPPPFPPGPLPQDDFADYMWMENEEEFDKQVMQQLEEEALMEQCIEAMLEDEQRERHRPVANGHAHYPTTSNGRTQVSLEETVSRSTLNPLAAEFIPIRARQSNTDEKVEPKETKTEEIESTEDTHSQSETATSPDVKKESRTEETIPAQTDPPEVSAADIQPIDKDKKPSVKKEVKKQEVKKVVKPEVKPKVKPVAVKSETKVQKKKEVKVVKSEVKVEGIEEVKATVEEVTQSPVEESTTPAFKPINYAAAAKANKPKKPTTPPATDKTAPPLKMDKPKVEKIEKKPPLLKEKVKVDKPVAQRKNSTK